MTDKIFTIAIESDVPDSDGDILSFEGIVIPEYVWIFLNFERVNCIGRATIFIEGKELKAKARFRIPEHDIIGLYPAISFIMGKPVYIDNRRILKNITIDGIGLCNSVNSNPNIKPIE